MIKRIPEGRTIYSINGEVNSTLATEILLKLSEFNQTRGPIRLVLHTPGGDVTSGIAIYEAIRRSRNPVTVTVTGTCESIGMLILQAAHHRQIYSTSSLMYHEGYCKLGKLPVNEAVKTALFTRDQFALVDRLIYDRVKPPGSFEGFQEQARKSIWLDAKQAKKLGYVDEIV